MAAESSLDVQSEMISEVGVGISVSYILVYAKENTNSPLHIIIIIIIVKAVVSRTLWRDSLSLPTYTTHPWKAFWTLWALNVGSEFNVVIFILDFPFCLRANTD